MELSLARKKRLFEDGYVVVPRVVSPDRIEVALREINHRLGAGEHPGKDAYADAVDYLSEYVDAPAVLDLHRGPVLDLVESLLGVNKVEACTHAQIALRFPSEKDDSPAARSVHIDGMYSKKSPKPIARYTLAVGVFLSDVPKKNMGNFLAFPGTHRLIARRIKQRGVESMRTGIEQSIALPEPVQLTGKKGDIVLFHFQLAHDKARNDSPDIRYMSYFRFWHVDAWHDSSDAYLKRALTDLWLEWPAMGGLGGA